MSNTGPGPNAQTNLVISIVAPVIAVIAVLVLYFTKPPLVPDAAPAAVNVAAAKLPDPGVQLANALPGSGGGAAAPGAGGPPGGAGFGRGGPGGGRGPVGAPGGGGPAGAIPTGPPPTAAVGGGK